MKMLALAISCLVSVLLVLAELAQDCANGNQCPSEFDEGLVVLQADARRSKTMNYEEVLGKDAQHEQSNEQRDTLSNEQKLPRTKQKETNEDTDGFDPIEYRENAKKATEVEWNWILIKLVAVANLPKDHGRSWFGYGKVDVKVSATAVGRNVDAGFGGGRLQQYVWPEKRDTDDPRWSQIGLLAFKKASANHIKIDMVDIDFFSHDVLISTKIRIPSNTGSWMGKTIECTRRQYEKKLCKKTRNIACCGDATI